MSERPQLVMTDWSIGEPTMYKRLLCGQIFLLREDRSPKEGVAELWAAFKDHAREQHPEEHPREEV